MESVVVARGRRGEGERLDDVVAWSASTGAGVSSGTGRRGWWRMTLVVWARWERDGLAVGEDTLGSLEGKMSASELLVVVAVVVVVAVAVVGGGDSVGCRVLSRMNGIAAAFVLAVSSAWEGGEPFIVDALVLFASSS